MIARQSQLFIPTLREAPADAEAVSHKLLVRGGYIRQLSAGVWTFLPLGWRVHQKVVQIIREEMDAIGGQEMLMPVLTPAELWETTGRDSPEIFRLEDRAGRRYILPMTHEETVTFHAREIQSYRQLPQILYHFAIKERDEPRSRGGLLRMREFIMKDAYSFDRSDEEFARSFELHRQAYHRMLERVGLEFYEVEAESGMMGGQQSQDFLCPAGSGENTLVTCENGDYAADLEIAKGVPRAARLPRSRGRTEGGRDAGCHDDRVTRGAPRDRRLGHVEGDAGRDDGRDARAGSRTRRRPAVRVEDARRARERLSAGDG